MDYISREEIKQAIQQLKSDTDTVGILLGINRVGSAIASLPTADVEEVKHGEWIEDAYYDNPCVCSYCGVEAPYFNKFEETFDYDWEENLVSTGHKTIKEYIRTQYCHRCGAKMDGERK